MVDNMPIDEETLEALELYLDVFQLEVRQHLSGKTLRRLSRCLMEIDQADVRGDLITNYQYLSMTPNQNVWLYPGIYVTHWISGENASFDVVLYEYEKYNPMFRHAMIKERTAKIYRVPVNLRGYIIDTDCGVPVDVEQLPHDIAVFIEQLRKYAFERRESKTVDLNAVRDIVSKRALDTLELRSLLSDYIPF